MKVSGKNRISFSILVVLMLLGRGSSFANPYSYPAIRYASPLSESLGGVTLPITDEIGNSIFNNPAALGRNPFFRAEYLNLALEVNPAVLGSGSGAFKYPSLGSFSGTLNGDPNSLYSGSFSNLTAFAWGGFSAGILLQERTRTYSDGTNVHYETLSQVIPAVGYGLALARGVFRIGYSLQYVNQASGITQSVSDGNAAYLSGLSEGKGFSHTASLNLAFPFAYLPTLSLAARNLFGLHYLSGSLVHRAKSPTGVPSDEPMGIDASLSFMARLGGAAKSYWYLQYKDLTSTSGMTALEKLNVGVDLSLSPYVGVRFGMTGTQFSGGIGYRSESSEINLAYYHELNPFTTISTWDTRYGLQYKVFFQEENRRDRDAESRGR